MTTPHRALLQQALNAPEQEPVAEVYRLHLGGRARNIGVDDVRKLNGVALPPPGTKLYAAPPAAPAPDGWVTVPNYRGYAALGTGRYILDISADANPAELIIHVATEAEKEGRTVGDLRDRGGPGESIAPEKMAVRLAFFTVAGLDALEQQLRILRKTHFPAAPVPDGWVMVPREPTEDMLDKGAMEIAMNNQRVMPAEHKAEHVYRAMIAASPAAPAASVVPQPAQRTADCLMCGHCAATGERVAKPAVPLTDEQIRSMWKSSEFRGNGGQVDWFCEGIRAAEAHHGITGASK